jgi:cytochrome c553
VAAERLASERCGARRRVDYNRALHRAASADIADRHGSRAPDQPERKYRMNLTRLLLTPLVATLPLMAVAQDKKAVSAATDGAAPVSMCIGCHSIPGYQASFPQVYRVPKIGGQSQQYIETVLKDYRQGNRSHPSMVSVAKGLTDQQIAAVAAYYAARGK